MCVDCDDMPRQATKKTTAKAKPKTARGRKPMTASQKAAAKKLLPSMPKTTKKKSPDHTSKGKFAKGNQASVRTPKTVKRVTAREILDTAAKHLAIDYQGTRVERVFSLGFSPIKELMCMYAEECEKKRPSFDKRFMILKTLLPYLYPQMKAVEFEIQGDLPTLKFVLAKDDNEAETGKNGHSIQSETKQSNTLP